MSDDSRTLRNPSEVTVQARASVESPREGFARPGLRVRCRDLEARVELLENALVIDRLHVDFIRQEVQELQIRTASLADEICTLQSPGTEVGEQPTQVQARGNKELEPADFDGLFIALICFIVWITIGYKVIYAH